jgi:hypothetical protein
VINAEHDLPGTEGGRGERVEEGGKGGRKDPMYAHVNKRIKKLKLLERDKESHFILIKRAIFQEEIIINLYVPNVSTPNFNKHTIKDLKPHIDPNTGVVGEINTPLSTINRSCRQNKNKEILELNDIIDLMEPINLCRVFNPATAKYTFFIVVHGSFFKIDHILWHKASLNKY